ncbi:MAG TPA: SRPBCC domain-containing protein [Acidobacteriaceae bacterium]|jgi:uncharacterized protein YndB with AHSA1/START domain|nr:SRPBCC domain-containing protein [Acidobacteriaceae bacterium]
MEPSTVHNTFVIEQLYPYPPETLYAAFSDPARKRRWFADSEERVAEQYDLDFRIGGLEHVIYRMGTNTPFPGIALTTVGTVQDIIPNQRVVTSQTMSLGDRRISSALITVEFLPNAAGTDLVFTHQAAFYEGSGGPEMREQGWRGIFGRLEKALAAQK